MPLVTAILLLLDLLLTLLFSLLLHRQVMGNGAASHRTKYCVVVRVVTSNTADDGAFKTTRGECRRRTADEENTGRNYNYIFHAYSQPVPLIMAKTDGANSVFLLKCTISS
jgi:hypothetical protein